MELPLDGEKFRSRRSFKLLVSESREFVEKEPNDEPGHATPIEAPCAVAGRIDAADSHPTDVDLFQFQSTTNQHWIIETIAAQRSSPIDTKLEVLHQDGTPVERL